jgi:light-regulated signal transduction histidine kinase (bacteriophytochrome)
MVNNPQIEQLKAGESLIIADVQSIDEPISPAGKKLIKAGVRSAVTTPLMADERLIGLMSLTDKQPHFFSIEYQEVIEEVANQLAIALRQQQLREAIQQYNELLEERVRQRTAKLNALNRELETFTYSVSHDLKAPLRGIDGYSQLLLEGYADKLDEDGRSFLRKVRYAAEHMNQLIEDLLTYSRLERREMHVIELDIHALVNALVNEHTTDIQNQNSIVDIDIPFRLIRTDRDGLAMALRNLIENAFKFSRNEPTPQIKISGQETEKSCILWVQDNGIGFDMAHQERIFEIFQRLHRSEIFPGTGIGLALVRKAMDRLDGKAWAESNPGQGAKFYLELKK